MKKITILFAASALMVMSACGSKESKSNSESEETSTEYSVGSESSEGSSSSYSSGSVGIESSEAGEETTTVASSGTEDFDSLLKEYEEYVSKAAELLKKASKGDISALSDYQSYVDQAQSLGERLQAAKGDLTPAQVSKVMNLQKKLMSAMSSYKIDPAKAAKLMDQAASKMKEAYSNYGGEEDSDNDDDDDDD